MILTLAAVSCMSVTSMASNSTVSTQIRSMEYYLDLSDEQSDALQESCAWYQGEMEQAMGSEEKMKEITLVHLKEVAGMLENYQYKLYLQLLNLTLHNKDIIF